jgi:hypothetical protein
VPAPSTAKGRPLCQLSQPGCGTGLLGASVLERLKTMIAILPAPLPKVHRFKQCRGAGPKVPKSRRLGAEAKDKGRCERDF